MCAWAALARNARVDATGVVMVSLIEEELQSLSFFFPFFKRPRFLQKSLNSSLLHAKTRRKIKCHVTYRSRGKRRDSKQNLNRGENMAALEHGHSRSPQSIQNAPAGTRWGTSRGR